MINYLTPIIIRVFQVPLGYIVVFRLKSNLRGPIFEFCEIYIYNNITYNIQYIYMFWYNFYTFFYQFLATKLILFFFIFFGGCKSRISLLEIRMLVSLDAETEWQRLGDVDIYHETFL